MINFKSQSISTNVCAILMVAAVVCLIPVVVLYWLFDNYFELTGTWKGVVASGPIAAYALLYYLTIRRALKVREPLMKEKEFRDLEIPEAQRSDLPIEIPNIEGTWKGRWDWRDEETGDLGTNTEDVIIKQKGREIDGTIMDSDGQKSAFHGTIFARMVTLYFVSERQGRPSCGSVSVKISADERSMEGRQIYYDLVYEELIGTVYSLQRE
ncbi:MAG: hypothetical protein ACYS32_01950 [Planctomycetota bacterium]|jgi:hypothetical protein